MTILIDSLRLLPCPTVPWCLAWLWNARCGPTRLVIMSLCSTQTCSCSLPHAFAPCKAPIRFHLYLSLISHVFWHRQLKAVHIETFGKTGCRRIVPGQYLAADPQGRAIMISAVEKQKLVGGLLVLYCMQVRQRRATMYPLDGYSPMS